MFSGKGEKFTERVEREVEAIVADGSWTARSGEPGPVPRADLVGAYLDHLRAVFPEASSLKQFRLGVDCANGATTTVAPALLDSLGLDIVVIGNQPDGRNINLNCGSTHPELLARAVVERGCQMGVAFDGDGDRAIFVDHSGRIVDGDAVLLMCGAQLQREGRLKGDAIVATVMSNIGLELALRALGIDLVRTDVGDKYVMEEMQKRGLSLGGEQSGHVIFSGLPLHRRRPVHGAQRAADGRAVRPFAGRPRIGPDDVPAGADERARQGQSAVDVGAPIADAMARVEANVAGHGRLLVRYSGTEPVLRVMLEGKDQEEIRRWGQEIVDVVKTHLGRDPRVLGAGCWVLGAMVPGAMVPGAMVPGAMVPGARVPVRALWHPLHRGPWHLAPSHLAVLYQDISHIRKMRSHGGDACVVWPMTRYSEPS